MRNITCLTTLISAFPRMCQSRVLTKHWGQFCKQFVRDCEHNVFNELIWEWAEAHRSWPFLLQSRMCVIIAQNQTFLPLISCLWCHRVSLHLLCQSHAIDCLSTCICLLFSPSVNSPLIALSDPLWTQYKNTAINNNRSISLFVGIWICDSNLRDSSSQSRLIQSRLRWFYALRIMQVPSRCMCALISSQSVYHNGKHYS